MAGATWNCCHVGEFCVHHTTMHRVTSCKATYVRCMPVYCLAVTCHLHFWQTDRNHMRATAVTRGCNGYRNKSHHRKLTLEKKILSPLPRGFEPATFGSRVGRCNHWATPAPSLWCCCCHQQRRSDGVVAALVVLAWRCATDGALTVN